MSSDSTRTWDWDLIRTAADLAFEKHRGDLRKGGDTPYVSHVWSVAAIVLEHGGDSDQAAAALLHDVAEDHGGRTALEEIRRRTNDRVADLVAALSDTLVEDPAQKPEWRQRKEDYLAHLVDAPADVLLVSAADKLANLRSMVRDHREVGDELWRRFRTESAEDQFWYYTCLVEIFEKRGEHPVLVEELDATLTHLMGRAGVA